MLKNTEKTMDKLVALCKNRGFVYAGSEIYGGLANTWDYGPLGAELKNNIKRAWWKKFVQENPYNVGLDAAILMNPQTWVASGHLGGFSDPLMDCRECHERFGKSFRNEITPGNFIFRVREFEQMELEFFCEPNTDLEWFAYWRGFCKQWLLSLGMKEENLRLRDHDPEELCFYSKATTDFEFLFPFGWGELWGVADRTDYDLTQHQNTSGRDLTYYDQEKNQRYIPYVIEPSLGVERSFLAFLADAYDEEVVGQDKKGNDDIRVVLHLHPALAPFKAAVLPLSKKLSPAAEKIYHELQKDFMIDFDDAGSIGKRYRREDEIGTPYCITVDFDTVGDPENGIAPDNAVTVRDRDTMQQKRIPISELKAYLTEKIKF